VRASYNPLSLEGSLLRGGRYNPPSEFGALYASLRENVALQEVFRAHERRGIDLLAAQPGEWWVYTIQIETPQALDLTNPRTLQKVNINADQLMGEDYRLTRKVAAEARTAGIEALLVPAVANPAERNLVAFSDVMKVRPQILTSRAVDFRSIG